MHLILVDKKHEAPDAMSFVFHPEKPLRWEAGQFTELTIPHPEPDDRGIKRYFTISAAPFEEDVMITTRYAGAKSSSFKKTLFNLPFNTSLEAAEPQGDFTMADHTEDTILIAGGAGITPYRSILQDMDHRNVAIDLTLLYSNRDEHFIFREELEALARKHKNFKMRYVTSPARVDVDLVRELAPDLSRPRIYVSGPEIMVENLEKALLQAGVPAHHLKNDYFPGYVEPWSEKLNENLETRN